MNKTDLVFYLSMAVTAWKAVSDQVHALVSGNVYAWLNIVFIVAGTVAYALYEKLQGITTPPQS